ncbi:unnamed protein product [Ectocarpus fasciculatus]
MEDSTLRGQSNEPNHRQELVTPRKKSQDAALAAMLEVLREQDEERRLYAAPLATSLLRSCGSETAGGSNRARERAQATVHEALRCLKANTGNSNRNSAHYDGPESLLGDPLFDKEFGGALNSWVGDQRETAGPAWLGGATQDNGETFFEPENNHGAIVTSVRLTGGTADEHYQHRPPSKADVRREGLLSATSRVTRHHMEPEWAAVELLDCIKEELTPRREAEQQQHERSSQMMLDAIRVLPAPEAGDLFVTCAARGHVGVVLFYFEEGLPIDHSHTTLKYQALHAAVEFGHLDSARLLVAMGAKVDARGGADDRSPLFLAALAKRWDACTWLLEVGASKIIRDKKGLTAYQAMAGSSDPEVAGRSGMLTDPPQRIVSVSCRGITHNTLDLTWSEPLRSYDEEVFVGYMVEWRPMRSRPVCPAHSRHVAERVRPPRKGKKKRGRAGWQGAEIRPGTAEEACTTSHQAFSTGGAAAETGRGRDALGTASASSLRRPNTGGGETTADEALPWKSHEVETFPLRLKHLHPATNYMVRVSARTLAGYGIPSREALLRTRVSPPSAPKEAANMVSATPNSITVGWVPPKYENGEPITRYEIQRLVLDQHHPDWDKGRVLAKTESSELLTTTTTTTTTTSDSSGSGGGNSNGDEDSTNTVTATTSTDSICSASKAQTEATQIPADAPACVGSHVELGSTEESGVKLPSVSGGGSKTGTMGEDKKQIGVWIGRRTEKLSPYHTAGGLPTYCRALFRVRAGNLAGWGPWSPSSDALEAQDIILPVKRGATQMLMRWFNKPDGEVLRWELSRRVFKYGTDFRGDNDDSWILCSRDIPGLREGESTFRCKGLMPGTEYQFRLRAYSNGCWQASEESIVSSPFKTICSPPDAPPACPRTRQLASDPLMVGGMVDTGALLSADAEEPATSCTRRGGNRNRGNGDGGGADGMGSVDAGGDAACSRRTGAAAAAAAVVRGKARAEEDFADTGRDVDGCADVGGESRYEGDSSDSYGDDERTETNGDRGAGEVVVKVARKSTVNGDGGAEVMEIELDDRDKRARTGRDDEERSRRRTHEAISQEEEHDEVGMGHTGAREVRLSNDETESIGESPFLPALSGDAATDRSHGEREEGKSREDESVEDLATTTELSSNASTTMVLEWDAGCSNGSLTTNYEVWGVADSTQGQDKTSGSGEWTLVALTEAAPTATLSGLREAQPYRFKVRARNGLGWSEFGPPTPPVVLNPLRPCEAPELVDRGVTWLALKLRAPPGAGLLLGFEMHMCRWTPGMSEGEETWSLVVDTQREQGGREGPSNSSTTTTTTTTTSPSSRREESRMVWDLKPGAGYRFKARARTVFGWSPGGPASDVYNTARRF